MQEWLVSKIVTKLENGDSTGISSIVMDDKGRVLISLANGDILNDLLPIGVTIVQEKRKSPRYVYKEVRIDRSKLANYHYRSELAHEIGHALCDVKMATNTPERELNLELLFQKFEDRPLSYKLGRILDTHKVVLQNEIDAWGWGKPYAELMGVDETTYEEMMSTNMTGYYSAKIYEAADQIKEYCPEISEGQQLRVFNPFSMNEEEMTFGQLTKLAANMESLNDKAIKSARRKTSFKK